ncbi:MAG: NAD+ synthase [Acidimicrobiia bacterium]|nr:NAD+ synthase [Acidimicrobiia bacterium]
MSRVLRVAGAQLDLIVGDIAGNTARIADAMLWAEEQFADVLLVPELAITGYPPEDLVLREGFVERNLVALESLAALAGSVVVIVGFVDRLSAEQLDDDAVPRTVANAAAVLHDGRVVSRYHKTLLPNYGVFDEARYFAEGRTPPRLHLIGGVACGISICEDIWDAEGRPTVQARAGAEVLLNINGSPFHARKSMERLDLLVARATNNHANVVYVNCVGGQDELVFDGASTVVSTNGDVLHRSPQFSEDLFVADVTVDGVPRDYSIDVVSVTAGRTIERDLRQGTVAPILDETAEIYAALATGLRDYVHKNGFSEVVIGFSGGIDSALTAAIAVDALGADAVHGVMMPTRYSSKGSIDDSVDLAERLGVRVDLIDIDDLFGEFLDSLSPLFAETVEDAAEENLQARIRGTILMAISNKFGAMVLATGNKSELAVGYTTLYGDMAGGFSVLKDVYKTTVYELAKWRNTQGEVIPVSIIAKPPSAELRPDQLDADSLPPYPILDDVLRMYIEDDMTAAEIIAAGHDAELVRRIAGMVDRNEYKRRQAAPGVRITTKAFGRDRRLPITNRFVP